MIENQKTAGGEKMGERFSVILTDLYFENKLKAFDPNLKLMFDKMVERWKVVEWALDGSGWNTIVTAEDEKGNPKELGEWVFNRLYVYRDRHLRKKNMGVDNWINSLAREAKTQRETIQQKLSDETQYRLRNDVLSWRKAAKQLDNLPASDVTAGFRKV